jgi:hypothetical protein
VFNQHESRRLSPTALSGIIFYTKTVVTGLLWDEERLVNRVYQSVFTSTYLLATSYPPPDMLSSGELNKKGAEGHVEWEGKEETKAEEKPKQTKKKVKAKAKR